MSPTALRYKYVFDTAYCRAVISRFHRQRPFYLRLNFQFAAIALVMLAWFSTLAVQHSLRSLLISACVTAAVIVGFMFLVRATAMTKLRGTREFGKEVTIALSDEGLEAMGPNGHSSVKWSAYPHAVRFPDGILLRRGGAIRWLPDSALEEGSLQEVLALIRSKTKLRDF